MKRIGALLLVTLLAFGCSKGYWLAKFYLFRAENTFSKAYTLKAKKVSYEKRLKYYRQACQDFLRAYDRDSQVFSLYRIETAAESCERVGDYETEEIFREFQERYTQEHPVEAEYGDAVPVMNLE